MIRSNTCCWLVVSGAVARQRVKRASHIRLVCEMTWVLSSDCRWMRVEGEPGLNGTRGRRGRKGDAGVNGTKGDKGDSVSVNDFDWTAIFSNYSRTSFNRSTDRRSVHMHLYHLTSSHLNWAASAGILRCFVGLYTSISKIRDGGGGHLENSKNRNISATEQLILTKFGTMMRLGPPVTRRTIRVPDERGWRRYGRSDDGAGRDLLYSCLESVY